ncbi:hypothetical protein [Saccharopolyspora sp. 6V]|uniref:hypothetical protein n=1 Tax=Saccharopolyspora sp. 6V TaxID=2877239 RepID=UPI001CD4F7D8|nr:hypothetical protein [Saccharopolyspora sp. 6V]MCA1191077.1 hypothetical protein [Saccharopolyspora sp. 6V]
MHRATRDLDRYEPYRISLAMKANGLVFVSGQAGIDEHRPHRRAGDRARAAREGRSVRTRSVDALLRTLAGIEDVELA